MRRDGHKEQHDLLCVEWPQSHMECIAKFYVVLETHPIRQTNHGNRIVTAHAGPTGVLDAGGYCRKTLPNDVFCRRSETNENLEVEG